jgi:hypothetical protein
MRSPRTMHVLFGIVSVALLALSACASATSATTSTFPRPLPPLTQDRGVPIHQEDFMRLSPLGSDRMKIQEALSVHSQGGRAAQGLFVRE